MLDRKKARSAAPVKFHFKSTIAVRATTRKPTRLITSKPTRSTTSRPTIGKLILSRVYMIHIELSPSQYTDLPFKAESAVAPFTVLKIIYFKNFFRRFYL